jgi:hypothetical protein
MQTSLITYPKADRFIRIHQSILHACQGNACAAALVSFFEGWHNYRLEQIEYTQQMNLMLREIEHAPIIDTTGWQYHTMWQLKRGTMIWKSDDTITAAIEKLESIGFISTDVPDRLVLLHKTGRTKWFLLMAERVNQWLAEYAAKYEADRPAVRTAPAKKARKTIDRNADIADQAEAILKYRNKRRVQYWHDRSKIARESAITADRLTLVMKRIAEGFGMLELCLAIEGNLASEWHQGMNENGKIYDTIELVFRSAKHVEQFIEKATDAGIDTAQVKKAISGEEPIPTPIFRNDAERDALSRSLADHVLMIMVGPFDVNRLHWRLTEEQKEAVDFDLARSIIADRIEAEFGMFTASHNEQTEAIIKEVCGDAE